MGLMGSKMSAWNILYTRCLARYEVQRIAGQIIGLILAQGNLNQVKKNMSIKACSLIKSAEANRHAIGNSIKDS